MPTGAHLTNIANGLCGSFTSRNNELDGYWAIGKLRSLAEKYGQTTVLLNFLTSSIHPPASEFAPMLARYRNLLAKLAEVSRIPLEEITTAHIMLDFAPPPWPRIIYYKLQWGDQFTLTVTINADHRAVGSVRHAGYCRPHNPVQEIRSIRSAIC
ncbi:hypothetical protein [Duganella sp. BuS-21]|uniref:hypothetical protein n=1 Tax=Duganella sp. BuS-21 TaxID=2943848 RepID=UPI0035A715DB